MKNFDPESISSLIVKPREKLIHSTGVNERTGDKNKIRGRYEKGQV
jgi:hypothetical protein